MKPWTLLILVTFLCLNMGCASINWAEHPENNLIYDHLSAVGSASGSQASANLACREEGKKKLEVVMRAKIKELVAKWKEKEKLPTPFEDENFLKAFLSTELIGASAHAYREDSAAKTAQCLVVRSLGQFFGQLRTQGIQYSSKNKAMNKEQEVIWNSTLMGLCEQLTQEHNQKANLKLVEGGVEKYMKEE